MIIVKLFSAEWCQPCKALKPQLEAAFGDKLVVVDVEKQGTQGYQINGLPTVVVEKNGWPTFVTAPTKAKVQKVVKELES